MLYIHLDLDIYKIITLMCKKHSLIRSVNLHKQTAREITALKFYFNEGFEI